MKPEDKSQIMQTLGSLTNTITKLQLDIRTNATPSPFRVAKSKAQVRTLHTHTHTLTHTHLYYICIHTHTEFERCCCCVQAQKELLDTELDLYQKSQAGEDTAQLKIKYTQLQIEVSRLPRSFTLVRRLASS